MYEAIAESISAIEPDEEGSKADALYMAIISDEWKPEDIRDFRATDLEYLSLLVDRSRMSNRRNEYDKIVAILLAARPYTRQATAFI
jgi:hypothetical protein